MRSYLLTDDQASWVAELLRQASDPASGIVDTTSGGGYSGDAAVRLFDFLSVTAQSVDAQRGGGQPLPADSGQ